MYSLLVIVDDPDLREWLVSLLRSDPTMVIVGYGADIFKAYVSTPEAPFATIILVSLLTAHSSKSPFWLDLNITYPTAQVVVLIEEPLNELEFLMALQSGVHCFVFWKDPLDDLCKAIRSAAQGRRFYSSSQLIVVATRLIREVEIGSIQIRVMRIQEKSKALAKLTKRECELLLLIGKGMSNYEIAIRLNISERTVRNYLSHIFRKMGFMSRTQAALWVNSEGFNEN